jgi:putative addiction module killer protein
LRKGTDRGATRPHGRRNNGDVKSVGGGVNELRIDYGLGCRVYFMQSGAVLVVVLAGGDKRTQHVDIKTAQRIAAEGERGS